MDKKIILRGDIVRIRHNESLHQFKENELVVVKETYPLWNDSPTSFKCVNRQTHWMVCLGDITLFERNPDREEF